MLSRILTPLALRGRGVLLLALLAGAGCTHLNAVGGGITDDDFYLITNKSFLGLSGPAVVLHCDRATSGPVMCERVLTTAQAAGFARNDYDDAYLACADIAEYDWVAADAPHLEHAVAQFTADGERALEGCHDGYAATWNGAARLWNADNPDQPQELVRPAKAPDSAPRMGTTEVGPTDPTSVSTPVEE
jgi:hypothetical protein